MNQPPIYVGGGYSPLFWYCMLDWSLDRQAMWFYHNHSAIDQQLYQQQLAKNVALQAKINELEAKEKAGQLKRDPNYVDPEFKENPDLMYTGEYVEAAYNPVATPVVTRPVVTSPPVAATGTSGLSIVIWTFVILVVLGAIVYFVFIHRWGE